jgi:membrane protease YdiL (CAAX protease family)
VIVYIGTEVLSEVIAYLGGTETSTWQHTLLKLACFGLSTFVLFPFVLALPDGVRSLPRFLASVGLRSLKPIVPLVVLTASCYSIIVVSQLAGSLLYHTQVPESFVLDLSRHSLLDERSLIASFFEEVVLRGVMLAVLLRRYSVVRSILVASAVFSGLHLLNALNPQTDTFWALAQATWAFALGALYSLLFVKTGSLYPGIVLHYLGNAMVGVWFRGLDSQSISSALYGLPFYGVLPALACIILVREVARRGYLDDAGIPEASQLEAQA